MLIELGPIIFPPSKTVIMYRRVGGLKLYNSVANDAQASLLCRVYEEIEA